MKRKIIIFLIILFSNFGITLGLDDLKVNTNIESGEYNNVLEIYLNTNTQNAKIFYYTDGEGRFDQIKEFKGNPIIIKKDTKLDYFANINEFDATKIQESNFKIVYPSSLSLNYLENNIMIKNTGEETINIGYWLIKTNNLTTDIQKNTFINPNESYKIPYEAKDNENIKLLSPDFSIEKNYTFKKVIIPKSESKTLTNQIKNEDTIINNQKENYQIDEILDNSKSSVFENKNYVTKNQKKIKFGDNFYQTIILFIILIIGVGFYNIFFSLKITNLRNLRKIKKLKKVYK